MQFKWANPEKTAVHIETAPNCWSRYYEGSAEWDKYAPQLGDYVDPRTAQQIWEAEASRLDNELVSLGSLARTIEDLATVGAVSLARKDLLAPVIAERVAHRLVKPA